MKYTTILILTILALAVAACGGAPTASAGPTPIPTVIADDTIIAEGRLEPVHFMELSLNASGMVSEVLVEEGGKVKAGSVIARLASNEALTLEDARAKASQELSEAYQQFRDARSRLDDFIVPPKFDDMTPAQAVDAMLENLNKARADFEPYRHLDPKKVKSGEKKVDISELDPEQLEYHFENLNKADERPVYGEARVKKKALENAWNLYRIAIQWLERETAFQNAEVRLINAQRDYAALEDSSFSLDTAGIRAVLANAELRAPYSGAITDLGLKVGEFAAAGHPVVTIADTSRWIVKTTDLTEIDVVNIEEGQPVTVKFDALPGMEFKGNVLSIGNNYTVNQGDVVYEVVILLTEKDPAMRWGMTAVVTFE